MSIFPAFNADPVNDDIIHRALVANSAFYDELRETILDRLRAALRRGASLGELLDLAQQVILEFQDPFASVLTDSWMVGWVNGAGRVAGQLPAGSPSPPGAPPPGPPPDRFTISGSDDWDWDGMRVWLPMIEEAIHELQAKNLVLKPQFDQLSLLERGKAFTIAGQSTMQAVSQVHQALVDTMQEGPSLRRFTERVDSALGASTLAPNQMENVYRTNLASAYSRGQDAIHANPIVSDWFPYVAVMSIPDSRRSELCAVIAESGLDGTSIYRVDDPTWLKFKEPRHFR